MTDLDKVKQMELFLAIIDLYKRHGIPARSALVHLITCANTLGEEMGVDVLSILQKANVNKVMKEIEKEMVH